MPSTPALYRLPQTTPGSASGIYTRSIGAALLLIFVALWATTQWAAWRLHFLPALGTPWLALSPSPASSLMARSNCSAWPRSDDSALAKAALGFDPLRHHSGRCTGSLGRTALCALEVPGLGLALRQEPAGGTHLSGRPLADRDPGPCHRPRGHARLSATGKAPRPADRQPRLGEVGKCGGLSPCRKTICGRH